MFNKNKTKQKTQVQIPSIEEVSLQLTQRIEKHDQKIQKLIVQIVKLKKQMGKMKEGKKKEQVKKQTIRLLKQKKMIEKQQERLYQQQSNLEHISSVQESLKPTIVQVKVLKQTNSLFKQQFKEMGFEDVMDAKDEMEDILDQTSEIQETLSQNFGVPDEFEEGDLETELQEIEGEMFNEEQNQDIPSYLDVPNVDPKSTLQDNDLEDEEEDEFDLLQLEKN
ncbi:vacuolar protein sorting-associated protein 60.1 [Anaeramoeba flamelloides]|uniref:Vacuolar protein sorting-associated protein 60.1 n=1 Tax=Anaeramoeba flamelloides TaxID=1746091 RepID=A0AAV7Z8V5_9EUKA|nr:vacuolar protein sorting-associated protein 60.1 [Anaeramoeba flamelloides]